MSSWGGKKKKIIQKVSRAHKQSSLSHRLSCSGPTAMQNVRNKNKILKRLPNVNRRLIHSSHEMRYFHSNSVQAAPLVILCPFSIAQYLLVSAWLHLATDAFSPTVTKIWTKTDGRQLTRRQLYLTKCTCRGVCRYQAPILKLRPKKY